MGNVTVMGFGTHTTRGAWVSPSIDHLGMVLVIRVIGGPVRRGTTKGFYPMVTASLGRTEIVPVVRKTIVHVVKATVAVVSAGVVPRSFVAGEN